MPPAFALQAAFEHLPRQRKLDEQAAEQAKKMLQLKANKKLLQQHIHNKCGKIVTLKDLHNLAGTTGLRHNVEELVEEMKQTKGTVIALTVL